MRDSRSILQNARKKLETDIVLKIMAVTARYTCYMLPESVHNVLRAGDIRELMMSDAMHHHHRRVTHTQCVLRR